MSFRRYGVRRRGLTTPRFPRHRGAANRRTEMGSHGERAASLTKTRSGHDACDRRPSSPLPSLLSPPLQFAHISCLAGHPGLKMAKDAARCRDVDIRKPNRRDQRRYLLEINKLGFLLTNRAAGALINSLVPCTLACGKGRTARGPAEADCKPGREHIGGAKRRSE